MTSTLLTVAVAATPLLTIVGLVRLMDWIQRRREARYARQIELTDAIHRELGAIAAPTVHRRRGGGWLVHMTVPLHRPAVVAALLRVTDQVFASRAAFEIVLTPAPPSPASLGASPSARRRPLQSGAPLIAATR
jgi:hypothetical protein